MTEIGFISDLHVPDLRATAPGAEQAHHPNRTARLAGANQLPSPARARSSENTASLAAAARRKAGRNPGGDGEPPPPNAQPEDFDDLGGSGRHSDEEPSDGAQEPGASPAAAAPHGGELHSLLRGRNCAPDPTEPEARAAAGARPAAVPLGVSGPVDTASPALALPAVLMAAHAKAMERVEQARTEYQKAKLGQADITAHGANRTLLKKCLGVALAAVAVALLAVSTAGTGLIVVAAVKLVICAGDAYYAKRVRDHHQAVAAGQSPPPLPPMGASAVGNLAYGLFSLTGWSEQAVRGCAGATQFLATAGLVFAGFGLVGLSPADLGTSGDKLTEMFASHSAVEVTEWTNNVVKSLLYGAQFRQALSHQHAHPQHFNTAAGEARKALEELACLLEHGESLPDDLLPQAASPWRKALEGDSNLLSRAVISDMRAQLEQMASGLHAHDSHVVAGATYLLSCMSYGAEAITAG